MDKFTEAFQQFFGPLSPAQRAMFIGLMVVIVGVIGGLFYWSQQEDKALLFGSLNTDAAQEIVTELESRGISYELRNGGTAIYVPSTDVHEMRLALAPLGGGLADVKGYELFDSNTLGMTDFMQQVNKKRALEGELSRSINTLVQIESSRVHLVLPERSPFEESAVEASASVILKMNRGAQLKEEQIEGITALISGSVESLDASNVTILDQVGNRLTDEIDYAAEFGFGSTQMQLRQKTEAYLTERGQSMLDRVLGAGNSILRVSVEHDFDRLVRESELIDPDSRTIISEETQEQSNNDVVSEPLDQRLAQQGDASVVVSNNENSTISQTRNYEVNRTTEIFEKTQGEIKKLTASVLLNYKKTVTVNEEGIEQVSYEPHAQKEVEEFKEVVMMALGVQGQRGDQISIKQVEFFDHQFESPDAYFTSQPSINNILRWVLIGITFLVVLYLINNIRKNIGADDFQIISEFKVDDALKNSDTPGSLEGGANEPALDAASEDGILPGKDSQKQLPNKTYSKEEILNFVELKPAEAAQVMRAMIASDD